MATEKETREIEIIVNGQKANASLKELAAASALMTNQLAKMAQDDPRRAALIGDFQQIKQRVAATRAELHTYVKTEAEVREETERLSKANQLVVLNGQRVTASFREMRESGSALEKQLHELSADDPNRKKLLADYHALQDRIGHVSQEISGLKPGLDEAGKSGGFFGNAMSSALGFLTGGGALALLGQAFGFLKEAKGDFEESAQAGAQLTATLTSTGHAAGITQKEIEALASKRMDLTNFDDDLTKASASLLLTFTNIKSGVFQEALPAIQDLAQKMVGGGEADLKGASIQVGKALNDPIKGITALSRVGVSFSEGQKKVIESLVATGDVAGAQRIILGELNKEFGGSAEAARKAGGGLATLKMNFNDTKETIGGFVVGALSVAADWLGRLWEKTAPVRDIFGELWAESVRLYENLYDTAEALGLVSAKGDSAGFVAKLLIGLFTILTGASRGVLSVINSLVDGFINLYNKSELFRGAMGGLVGVFKGVAKAAWDYLGGVGDLLVGVFTLDTDKIKSGLKQTFGSLADLTYKSGLNAAENFNKGYNEAKDTRIVRPARGAAGESAPSRGASGAAPASSGQDEGDNSLAEAAAAKVQKVEAAAERAREAARRATKAAQDKADQEHLEGVKKWVQEEGGHLQQRLSYRNQLDQQGMSDEQQRREAQRQKIFDDEDKKYEGLSEKERAQTEVVAAIVAERDLRLRELSAKFAEEDEKERQAKVEAQITRNQTAEEERLAQLEIDKINGVLSEQQYQDAIYAVKMAAAARELELIKQKSGVESAEYKKLHTYLLKEEATHNAKVKAEKDGQVKFEAALVAAKKVFNEQDVAALGEAFGKKSLIYKAALLMQKTVALAEIGIGLQKQIAANSETGAKISALAPPFTVPIGVAYTIGANVVSIAGAIAAGAKIAGFVKGGRTVMAAASSGGGGEQLDLGKLRTDSSGKLRDQNGDEVAGLVHKNEYVIPEWLRADPQVVRIEEYLEARRVQGYLGGGETGPAPAPGGSSAAAVTGGPAESGAALADVLERVASSLEQLNGRLRSVEEWQRETEVHLSMPDLERELATRQQVRFQNGIRA